ncbi:hypothetical protein M378DRAFT_58256, partial [Amanita muscaria Koide BX008]
FWLFGTADTPALPLLNGLVGHGGRLGCRIFCGFPGRLKGKRYYPAALKPDEYDIRESSHDDIDVSKLSSPSVAMYNKALLRVLQATDTNYEQTRKAT